MKQRFNNLDLRTALHELKISFTGCRVSNIYDLDNKTYLIKLAKPDKKAVILIESGIRIHGTEFDWPKNIIPSGFSMKLRKHLRSRRLESVNQVGADRIVDLKFGSNEAAYHLIVELYDRGNIILTDHEYTIINILRPRTDADTDVRFSVREKYPLHLAKQPEDLTLEKVKEIVNNSKENEDIKKVLTFNLTYGASLVEHCLTVAGFPEKCIIGKNFDRNQDLEKLYKALLEGETIINNLTNNICKGYIIQKQTTTVKLDKTAGIENDSILTYEEFHPYLFKKHESLPYLEFESFDKAVDEFFSKLESQKIELKETHQRKDAIKKLENVKRDHQKRLEDLKHIQTDDEVKAMLIEYNLDMVDRTIFLVNSLIAAKHDWSEIQEIIDEAKEENHPIASIIYKLKLETNHIILTLKDPDEDYYEEKESEKNKTMFVEIDLGLNAFKNSRKYYESKKSALVKEQKTIDASDRALKSAEKKAFELLKQADKIKIISKNRKQYWFEKFYWFISSENYMVIGGRDQQQNEIVVKKYLKAGDLYVHADLHGASSVVIKNPTGNSVPPKTLNEAGCMAVCYSVAWEAKVLANAWWVYHHQVSKQAPTGEYLGTGSFMIRGKKNFLPQTALVFGFGVLYKLDDASLFRHKNERMVKTADEELDLEKANSNVVFEDVEVENEGLNTVEEVEEIERDQNLNKKIETATNADQIHLNEIENTGEKDLYKKLSESLIIKKEETHSTDQDENSDIEFPETAFEMKLISKIEEKQNDDENEEILSYENTSRKQSYSSSKISDKQEGQVNKTKTNPLKRGQKARLNKMKTKYKDQDDEDRELVMQYLASSGKNKSQEIEKQKSSNNNSNQKGNKQQSAKNKKNDKNNKSSQQTHFPNKKQENNIQEASNNLDNVNDQQTTNEKPPKHSENQVENNDLDQDDEMNLNEETEVIDSLTGQPIDEDEILFCMAVCAPYTTLQNYKHKVKLIPGTTKRGQAVKTAIEIFARDNKTTSRERDLIRLNLSKETETTRNLPGKVKVSAPNLNKLKKK